ncbi:glycosyltransferase family 4 protein [Pigmentiphaga sp. CHJ604]|uniref:glycosyltransferase family 4 protein n=1 Tax=Pigmentiphaga sp. CHJ604 TaxID=3081984 RepID=UPI0030CEA4EC
MRIVSVYDEFRIKGGVERVMCLTSSHWAEQGHEVTLLIRQEPVIPPYDLDARVAVHCLGGKERSSRWQRLLEYWKALRRLKQSAALASADVVVANGPWSALLLLMLGRRFKLVICDHNNPRGFGRHTRWLCRLLYPRADALIALTSTQRRYYEAHGYNRLVVRIPNPVNLVPTGKRTRQPIVIAVGRCSYQKGFDLLLMAWHLIRSDIADWRLLIIGEGELRTQLEHQAKELDLGSSVEFLPFSNDLVSFYETASLLAVSSRFEGFHLVMLEAQTCGLPIVSFDCDFGPRDIITDQVDGLLCAPEDVGALARGIKTLIDAPTVRQAMSLAALKTAQAYRMEKVGVLWDALFKQLETGR